MRTPVLIAIEVPVIRNPRIDFVEISAKYTVAGMLDKPVAKPVNARPRYILPRFGCIAISNHPIKAGKFITSNDILRPQRSKTGPLIKQPSGIVIAAKLAKKKY